MTLDPRLAGWLVGLVAATQLAVAPVAIAPQKSQGRAASTGDANVEAFARQALQREDAEGFVHVLEVASGRVIAHVNTAADLGIDSPLRPLSVIKVFVAASWLEHGFGGQILDCAPSANYPARRMLVEDVLISGCDTAGAEIALTLRRKLGSGKLLSDLRRFGVRDLTLPPDAGDAEWGSVLSLGEREVPVTPRQVSAFFRAIGQRKARTLSPQTGKKLRTALEGVVQHGTATSIKNALDGTGWRIGGKTGTGPGLCGDHCDGWFASLVSDQHRARYVVLVFIRGKGLGGGVAARIAVSVAEYLVTQDRR